MSDTVEAPFAPPARDDGVLAAIRWAGRNALLMWPQEAYEQDVFVQTGLGRSRFLLNGEAAIHRVLVGNAANYRRTRAAVRVLRPITGDGLLLSEGASWRRQRQIVGPALAPRVMPLLNGHVIAAAERSFAMLNEGEVDALGLMQQLTLDIAARAMFSLDMAGDGEAMRRLITGFGERSGRPSTLDFLLPLWVPTPRDVSRWAFRRRWVRLMDRIVARRTLLPPTDAPRDLFDLLRAATDPETGRGFTPGQLRDQMATLIVAGHETTALTLFWALHLVAGAPSVQARLAAEARATDPAAEAGRPGLPGLRFTRAVIQEALRLYPPAFTLTREAMADDRVGTLAVPRGSVVLIAPWVLHRHRRLWRDPERFDPSRFEGEAAPAHRFAYLPFGAGPRVCVGAQFALSEATLVLAMLMGRFEIARADGQPVWPVAVITTQPSRRARLRLRRRTGAADDQSRLTGDPV